MATWSPERIKRELDWSHYDDGRAKGHVAFVNPSDFLKATTKNKTTESQISSDAGDLDEQKLKNNSQSPFLRIKDGKIFDHEGRHRMSALAAAGHTSVPVILWHDTAQKLQPVDETTLKAQHPNRPALNVTNAIPLHRDYQDQIEDAMSDSRLRFGDGGDVMDKQQFSKNLRKWHEGSHENTKKHDGTPRVFYHGSDQERDIINPDVKDPGAWFTTSLMNASNYARGDEAHVHSVYLKAKNPFVVPFQYDENDKVHAFHNGEKLPFSDNVSIVKHARSLGHDSVHFPNGNFTESDNTFVVFHPTQIKSVNNEGNFDPQNPNINKADGGSVDRAKNLSAFLEGNHPDVPHVVYHATTGDFQKFDPEKANTQSKTGVPHGVFSFSSHPDVAGTYAMENEGYWSKDYKPNANIMPVHLSVKKPLVIDALGNSWASIPHKGEIKDINQIVKEAKASGKYDGVIVKNVYDSAVGKTKEGVGNTPTTSFFAFNPAQIKSATGNQGTFDSSNPDITKAGGGSVERRLNSLGLYSKGAEKASELPEGSFPAQQLIASLLNKGGISKDELLNAGVIDESNKPHPDWVKRGKISKQNLIDHFHGSVPKINEIVQHPDLKPEMNGLMKSIKALQNTIEFDEVGSPERVEKEKILNERLDRFYKLQEINDNIIPAKFQDLTLPYQKNYREILLQLDAPRQWQNGNPVTEEDLATEQGRADADRAAAFVNTPHKSDHWKAPNVLTHIRLSDRRGPRDEKILHVEELQSDWGQEGRDNGFLAKDETPKAGATGNEVPHGPYVTKTQSWTDLALKRVLKEAAEGGYDHIVWTPGKQQANRYSLNNHIDRIHHESNDDGTHQVEVFDPSGEMIFDHEGMDQKELGNHFGKEIAEKIANGQGEPMQSRPLRDWKVLSNLDLKTGGEGMEGYYNKIVPKSLQRLAQEHDPQAKVAPSPFSLPPDTERGDPDEPIKPLGLTITPQMRQSILQGQSAFRDGGAVDDEDEDGITAYHGSPHDFEQFDTSKIGTGEGAQAYGHGLYFAQNEDVAKGYKERLAPAANVQSGGQNLNQQQLREIVEELGLPYPAATAANAFSRLQKSDNVENYLQQLNQIDHDSLRKSFPKVAAEIDAEHALAKELHKRGLDIDRPNKGHMYEVHIKAHPNHFLDWDKPLREQPYILKAIDDHIGDPDVVMQQLFGHDSATGGDLHDRLGGNHKPAAVAQKLSSMGIHGIQYLDAGSRGMSPAFDPSYLERQIAKNRETAKTVAPSDLPELDEDHQTLLQRLADAKSEKHLSRNYVVFDHNHVAVKRKYAQGGVVG